MTSLVLVENADHRLKTFYTSPRLYLDYATVEEWVDAVLATHPDGQYVWFDLPAPSLADMPSRLFSNLCVFSSTDVLFSRRCRRGGSVFRGTLSASGLGGSVCAGVRLCGANTFPGITEFDPGNGPVLVHDISFYLQTSHQKLIRLMKHFLIVDTIRQHESLVHHQVTNMAITRLQDQVRDLETMSLAVRVYDHISLQIFDLVIGSRWRVRCG